MSTLKEAYDAHRNTLLSTIKDAVKGFEVNTGCSVLNMDINFLTHISRGKMHAALTGIDVTTNMDKDA